MIVCKVDFKFHFFVVYILLNIYITFTFMGKWLQGGHFIRYLGKKFLTPGLRVNLCYTKLFIRKVPLARFECWSNKKYLSKNFIQQNHSKTANSGGYLLKNPKIDQLRTNITIY